MLSFVKNKTGEFYWQPQLPHNHATNMMVAGFFTIKGVAPSLYLSSAPSWPPVPLNFWCFCCCYYCGWWRRDDGWKATGWQAGRQLNSSELNSTDPATCWSITAAIPPHFAMKERQSQVPGTFCLDLLSDRGRSQGCNNNNGRSN